MDEVINISIIDYLNEIGIPTRREGNRAFCSSPFSRDTNWSFCIYPSNTYFDFANGHGGNIVNLYSRINGVTTAEAFKALKESIKYEKYKPNYKETKRAQAEIQQPFNYQKYVNTDPEECKQIKAYAASRGISEGFFCGVFFERDTESERLPSSELRRVQWVRVPALGFLHVDKDNKPCGAKFRRIDKKEPRFAARGHLAFYILMGNHTELSGLKESVTYVVESESSANSLYEFLKSTGTCHTIISFGGVSNVKTLEQLPNTIPLKNIKLIIDYDGNEELYQERLKLYEGLGAEPIKLILPKGEDINSLYCKNQMWLIEHML